ncbi:MAG: MoaD/ThiS family protein [Chitinophagaceae bacterium]
MDIISFGKIAEIAGGSFSIDNAPDTDSLKKIIEQKFPALKGVKYLLAVDKKMIRGNINLDKNSVVALMPPFSGG